MSKFIFLLFVYSFSRRTFNRLPDFMKMQGTKFLLTYHKIIYNQWITNAMEKLFRSHPEMALFHNFCVNMRKTLVA